MFIHPLTKKGIHSLLDPLETAVMYKVIKLTDFSYDQVHGSPRVRVTSLAGCQTDRTEQVQ